MVRSVFMAFRSDSICNLIYSCDLLIFMYFFSLSYIDRSPFTLDRCNEFHLGLISSHNKTHYEKISHSSMENRARYV